MQQHLQSRLAVVAGQEISPLTRRSLDQHYKERTLQQASAHQQADRVPVVTTHSLNHDRRRRRKRQRTTAIARLCASAHSRARSSVDALAEAPANRASCLRRPRCCSSRRLVVTSARPPAGRPLAARHVHKPTRGEQRDERGNQRYTKKCVCQRRQGTRIVLTNVCGFKSSSLTRYFYLCLQSTRCHSSNSVEMFIVTRISSLYLLVNQLPIQLPPKIARLQVTSSRSVRLGLFGGIPLLIIYPLAYASACRRLLRALSLFRACRCNAQANGQRRRCREGA